MTVSRILATPLALVAWACLVCSANAGVKVRYFKGQPTFISTMPASAVEVAAPTANKDRRVWIAVVALNFAKEPASLGYENITVHTAGGQPAKLITYEELQHQARVRAGWATFFSGVAAGLNSYSAARYGGSGRFGGYSYYSPVAAQIALDRADAQNTALFTSIAQALDSTLAKLDGTVLRTTTIDPNASFGGFVAFDLPKGTSAKDMIVSVTFNGETHEVPLDNSTGTLQQATAADMIVPGTGTAAAPPSTPAPQASAAAYALSAERPPAPPARRAAPRCGAIPTAGGVKLIPCPAAE